MDNKGKETKVHNHGMAKRRHQYRSSFNAIHVRHLCCTVCFIRQIAGQKYFFQIRFQKNGQMVNLERPDLDLIRRSHPECGFYGFKIPCSIFPKKNAKSFFGFGNPDLDVPKRCALCRKPHDKLFWHVLCMLLFEFHHFTK